MKRIDFHLHTIPTEKDAHFDFDIRVLEEYVTELKLDAIAITNHNLFNLKQYTDICAELDINVFPGVEVDLEKGHILVIAPPEKAAELSVECDKLESEINTPNDYIDFETFKKIFPNYQKYLLIPHLDKTPVIKEQTLLKFEDIITCGEVRNAKRFTITKQSKGYELVPVLFSDFRIKKIENFAGNENKKIFPTRITYLDINELTLNTVKMSLADKNKVYINADKTANVFQVLNDGTLASTKLNLIVGSRSTGKTYTLQKVKDSFGDDERVKYIRQFEIVNNCDDKNFNKMIAQECDEVVVEYQKPLGALIDRIVAIDKKGVDINVDTYISTLKEFASQKVSNDIFSKTKIFNEQEFSTIEPTEAKRIYENLLDIYTNKKYRTIIEKYIDRNRLELLIQEIIFVFNEEKRQYEMKLITNEIIGDLKSLLNARSAKTAPSQCDFMESHLSMSLVKSFNQVINRYKVERQIYEKPLPRFNKRISKYSFRNATHLKKSYPCSLGIVNEFAYYNSPYEYIRELKKAGIPQSDLLKCFVGFNYSVTNNAGLEISGGERAEYKLEKEIKDAERYDILLIDEPESGFDNIFIKTDIIEMIRNIANKTVVFLVTHNSTLGPLIRPNWVIYNEFIGGNFRVYSGPFESKILKTIDGNAILNYNVLLDTMEAGEKAYDERRSIYENIKD